MADKDMVVFKVGERMIWADPKSDTHKDDTLEKTIRWLMMNGYGHGKISEAVYMFDKIQFLRKVGDDYVAPSDAEFRKKVVKAYKEAKEFGEI